MTDVTALQRKINRGKAAEGVLEDPIFKEVVESFRNDCFRAFRGEDEERAKVARHEVRAFEAFLTRLAQIHKEGVSAHKQIEQLRKREAEGFSTDTNDLQGIV